MNLHLDFLPSWTLYISLAVWLGLLVFTFPALSALKHRNQSILINTVMLSVMWAMQASISQGDMAGIQFHLVGAAISFSMLGFAGALWAMSMVVVLYALVSMGIDGIWMAPLNILVAVLPALVTAKLILWLARRFLPHHLFVYIFANGFFAGALSMLVSSLAICTALHLSLHYDAVSVWTAIFPVYFLLMWAEAFLTGLFTAIFVAFAPNLLYTYEDQIYLPNEGPNIYK